MSKSKAKGTLGESAVVTYLRANGFPGAERRALTGAVDQGDITGTPCLTWEVKNVRRYAIPQWMGEAAAERVAAKADYCPLIVKPVGVGTTRVGEWWAILTLAELTTLLRAAGYGDAL